MSQGDIGRLDAGTSNVDLPEPDLLVDVGGGRRVALDDRGDPDGRPVLFFHGTPDTRVARHPDDGIATELGIRLIAVDRPGLGGSDVDPQATPTTVADDHAAVLTQLGIERAGVLAWSAGAIPALAFAGRHADRVERIVLVAPLVPADAYADTETLDGVEVLEGSDDSRHLFADVITQVSPDEAGRELAMWLVPPQVDADTARELLADSRRAVAHVDGAGEALVAAMVGSVAGGMTGLEREITAQATPLGDLLDRIAAPTTVHVGDVDRLTPVAMSRWVGARTGGEVVVHAGAGHSLAIDQWAALLARAAGVPG